METKAQQIPNEVSKSLEKVNEYMSKYAHYKLRIVDPKDLKFLEKNARILENSTMQRLVENIKKDGNLESVPLCYERKDGTLLILSGNHRVEGAVKAGIEKIMVIVLAKELTKQEQIAKQLAHNAIEGYDDKNVLEELYDELDDVNWKEYSGIDERTFDFEAPDIKSISEAKVDFRYLNLIFLDYEVDNYDKLAEDIAHNCNGEDIRLVTKDQYERLVEALKKIKADYNIKNHATAFQKLLDVYEENEGEKM